jgi:hypothetical protein
VSSRDASATRESTTTPTPGLAGTQGGDSDAGLGSASDSDGGASHRVAPRNNTNRYRPNPNRRRFKLLRSFTAADFVTLGNAACGTCSIFFCLNYLENDGYQPYLHASFVLLPLALIFDILDGYVARRRQNYSPYGSDLDSLADVISFAVAPAVLAFTLGLRGVWDCLILSVRDASRALNGHAR